MRKKKWKEEKTFYEVFVGSFSPRPENQSTIRFTNIKKAQKIAGSHLGDGSGRVTEHVITIIVENDKKNSTFTITEKITPLKPIKKFDRKAKSKRKDFKKRIKQKS